MNSAAAERTPLKSSNLNSIIEGEELINTTDRSVAETTCSFRDDQQVRKTPSERPEETGASSHVSSGYASVLCRVPEKWMAWTTLHKLSFVKEDWVNEKFDKFMDSFKYPTRILEEDIMRTIDELVSHLPKGAEAQEEFRMWRDQLNRDNIEQGDKYQFEASLPILVNAWKTTLIHAEPVINEAANRRGTDTLIELAFQNRRGADHIWRPGVDMVLPGTPDTVKADAVASLTLPANWISFLRRLRNQHVFSWAWCEQLTKLPASTVTLGFEAEVDNPKVVLRQVQLTMFSSQQHRRALGLEDAPVFGATLNDNTLQFYVSNWENDTVVVRLFNDQFDLTEFDHFIECYFILCRISEFQSLWLKDEMKRWDGIRDQQETKLRNLAANPWRKKEKEDHKGPDENDPSELESDEADEDRGEVDIGTLKKYEIKLLEDRINRGESPPKDGYPLSEVCRYIFDHTPKFQPCCRVPSVSEWARDSSQFVGYHEDTDSDLLEYTMDGDVTASAERRFVC